LPKEAYAPEVTARVYCVMIDKARRALAAGQSVIVDAMFAKPKERDAVRKSADVFGVPFHGIFLDADLATRVARVTARDAEAADASDADAAVARAQESYDLGALDWTRIDASGTPEQTLAHARRAIEA